MAYMIITILNLPYIKIPLKEPCNFTIHAVYDKRVSTSCDLWGAQNGEAVGVQDLRTSKSISQRVQVSHVNQGLKTRYVYTYIVCIYIYIYLFTYILHHIYLCICLFIFYVFTYYMYTCMKWILGRYSFVIRYLDPLGNL